MLFLLKRTWQGSLVGLAVLLLLALGLRQLLGTPSPCFLSLSAVGLGLAVWAATVISDGVLHRFLLWAGGDSYQRRFHELVAIFRQQSSLAMLTGSLMAGLGEEPFFRGLSTDPLMLVGGALLFGLLHHIRWSLWPFTLWAIYEGLLFALALYLTGNLLVTMFAHFLHDLGGFLIFRRRAQRVAEQPVR
jgi:membrane protease YdiL (CAAX protease family)